MKKHLALELPIRSKLEMIEEIIQIIEFLVEGRRDLAEPLIDLLKARSLFLDETIQQDVLIFAEHVYFQYAYDPYHTLSKDVEKSADRLIEDLGFNLNKIKR